MTVLEQMRNTQIPNSYKPLEILEAVRKSFDEQEENEPADVNFYVEVRKK